MWMCQVLGMNRFSFYKWCVTKTRCEEMIREDKKMRGTYRVFDKEKGLYGGKGRCGTKCATGHFPS